MEFQEWFIPKMNKAGYEYALVLNNRVAESFRFSHTAFYFGVVYVKRPIDLEDLRQLFESVGCNLLLIIDSDLVTDLTIDDKWLRAIHALYFGRIYVWNGRSIKAFHHDRQTDKPIYSKNDVDVNEIKFEKVDCWYPGFPGVFNIARFNDPVFWKTEPKREKPPKREKDTSYEDFWKQEFERQKAKGRTYNPHNEDVFRDFREAFERNKRQYEANNPKPPPSRPRYMPTGDKWLTLLLAEGTLEGAKKKYRELAMLHHPDRAGNVELMQLINVAWEKAKEILV